MKKIVSILLVVIGLLLFVGCDNFFYKGNKVVKLQVIKQDVTTNKKEVYKEYVVNNEDYIDIDSELGLCYNGTYYGANDIKIISIEDGYVKISREKVKYLNNFPVTEEVIENIDYNVIFSIGINDPNPLAGMCRENKYHYHLMFIKD